MARCVFLSEKKRAAASARAREDGYVVHCDQGSVALFKPGGVEVSTCSLLTT